MTKADVTEQLVDDLKAVLERAEELLESTNGGSGTRYEAAREKLVNGISAIRKAQSEVQKKASAALESSGRFIKEHPYQTAEAGVLAAAFLAGVFWMWRNSR